MRLIWILTIGLFGIQDTAPAQDGRGPGRGRFGGPGNGFTILDTNGDGVLDAEEIGAASASLARLDKDGDGRITLEELRAAMLEGRGRGGPDRGRGEGEGGGGNVVEEMVKMLMAFDANGDGKLSRAEVPERFQGIFDRGDADKDGFLTPDEIRRAAAAQAAQADPERHEGRVPGGMNFIRMDPILAAVDADGDGVLSGEEIKNAAAAIRKLDKDGDGKVTREEAVPMGGRGRAF